MDRAAALSTTVTTTECVQENIYDLMSDFTITEHDEEDLVGLVCDLLIHGENSVLWGGLQTQIITARHAGASCACAFTTPRSLLDRISIKCLPAPLPTASATV